MDPNKITIGELKLMSLGLVSLPYCLVRHPKMTYRLLKYGQSW